MELIDPPVNRYWEVERREFALQRLMAICQDIARRGDGSNYQDEFGKFLELIEEDIDWHYVTEQESKYYGQD